MRPISGEAAVIFEKVIKVKQMPAVSAIIFGSLNIVKNLKEGFNVEGASLIAMSLPELMMLSKFLKIK
ncbi:MAG: hypothetical protein K6E98_12295 [Lachnospiraceae bacterium]|nr:hypothetical protein [Lachnospiraceae bacterium]